MISKIQIFSFNQSNLQKKSDQKFKIADCPADKFVKTNKSLSFKGGFSDYTQVSANYFRGKMPDSITLELLKNKGVNTIIDLTNGVSSSLKKKIKEFRMDYHNINLEEGINPTEEQMESFKKIVSNPEAKVFVHCREGRNRTGIMTATYEVNEKGRKFRNVFVDMVKNGYDFINYPNPVKFLGEICIKKGEERSAVQETIHEITSNQRYRNKLLEYNGTYY